MVREDCVVNQLIDQVDIVVLVGDGYDDVIGDKEEGFNCQCQCEVILWKVDGVVGQLLVMFLVCFVNELLGIDLLFNDEDINCCY